MVKHSGSNIMVLGCMQHGSGVGSVVRIDGNMDGELYKQILEDDLLGSLDGWDVEKGDIIFQQDNNPKHKSKKAQKWFQDNSIRQMVWPAQSPDLNPIEHLWWHLNRKLGGYETRPKGIEQLWERIQVEWHAIPVEVVDSLIESMPDCVAEVLKQKGGPSGY